MTAQEAELCWCEGETARHDAAKWSRSGSDSVEPDRVRVRELALGELRRTEQDDLGVLDPGVR